MASFKYRAIDSQGNPVEGTMEEASARRVVLTLQGQGLKVNSVDKIGPESRGLLKRSALSWSQLDQLNTQLVLITRGGLPLASSIAAMARDVRSPRLRAVLEEIRQDLEAGKRIEEAFARHPDSFSPVYMALVRAGERAGNLSGVFLHLSDYSRGMMELRGRLQEILTYPIILIVAACCVVSFLMLKVVPVFSEVYRDFGGRLPAPTQLLVDVSNAFAGYFVIVIAGLALLVALGFLLSLASERVASAGHVRDMLKSWTPLFGRLYVCASLVRFCKTLRLMLESNVPLLDSLGLSAAASGNAVLAGEIGKASRGVASGASLADSLEQTRYFDRGFCWLLRNAEQRGELPSALLVLEEEYERSLSHMRNSILNLVTPVVVVAIGFIVGFVIVSLYLPIFSLGDVIG